MWKLRFDELILEMTLILQLQLMRRTLVADKSSLKQITLTRLKTTKVILLINMRDTEHQKQ